MNKYFKGRSYRNWGEKIEKLLVRFVIVGLLMLILVQALMTRDSFRFYLSFAERLDVKRYENFNGVQSALAPNGKTTVELEANQDDTQTSSFMESRKSVGTVVLELNNFSSMQKASILINGQKVGDFQQKQVNIFVHHDDIIEIDGTFYAYPLTIWVKEVSENVRYPQKDQVIEVNKNLVRVGKVILDY